MPKLENKIALVTGSDSGMGQAMAEEFAKAGADVAVTFHTDEAGAEESRRRVQAAGRRAMVRADRRKHLRRKWDQRFESAFLQR